MSVSTAVTWETVIGLEVHAQLSTTTKMYCACPVVSTQELSEANRYVCPVCLGHPGTLPRPNRQAVVRALTLAEKLGATINERNIFARKNYFYPDLPKGYQISQYDLPLACGGSLPYWYGGQARTADLVRIHLEEDTAKLFHLADGTAALDYNRGGVPLIEIVTQPVFREGAECVAYLDELRSLLQRLGVSDAAMESGNMRCEPNVSVRPAGSSELRTKTELKNLNSFSTLRKAVEAEAQRQIAVYDSGGAVHQATLRFDDARGVTVEMRRKEYADDYRYFDEPDIPPVIITKHLRDEAAENLRASSFELRKMMVEEDGLPHEAAATIAGDHVVHRFYRLACKDGHPPKEVAKWATGELVRLLREAPLKIEPGILSHTLRKIAKGQLTLPQAKQVFEQCYLSGKSVDAVIEALGLGGGTVAIDYAAVAAKVIAGSPQVVSDIQGGKLSALQALVGQVMKETKGAADPNKARKVLAEQLGIVV